MIIYIIVDDMPIYEELINVFKLQSVPIYDIIYLRGRVQATSPGRVYILPEPKQLNTIPIHHEIDTIYTTDEFIVPQRYIISTYKAGEGYRIKYLEDLVI